MDQQTKELVWHRKILLVAITEQKIMAEQFTKVGLAMPFEENAKRMRVRLRKVQNKLEEIGYE